jgi:hypothetical protein
VLERAPSPPWPGRPGRGAEGDVTSDVSPALLGGLEDDGGVRDGVRTGFCCAGLVLAAYGSDLETRMHDVLVVTDAVGSERAARTS